MIRLCFVVALCISSSILCWTMIGNLCRIEDWHIRFVAKLHTIAIGTLCGLAAIAGFWFLVEYIT